MSTVTVKASRCYEVRIERGCLQRSGELIRPLTAAETAVIVSGEHVGALYGDAVGQSLERAGFRVLPYRHPSGEKSKCMAEYARLLETLSAEGLTRRDVIVALGGGVTGDLAGFAAATYQRGMDLVQIPTSLLAMVDSSVGGKTAIDLPTGKNQVGCFYQPLLVLCDPDVLATLPEEEYRCGSAEVIKYGLLGNAAFFHELEQNPIREQEERVIETCVSMKRDLVQADEFDRGQRQLLNLGHSFGHAVEACSNYQMLHGQAVAVGMAIMCRAAAEKGICHPACRDAVLALLHQNGLPTETEFPREKLLEAVRQDKKRSGDHISLVIPEAIGRCRIEKTPLGDLEDWLRLGGVR